MRALLTILIATCLLAASLGRTAGQAGRRPNLADARGVVLNIIATREQNPEVPITAQEVAVFENGIEQPIKNFSPDPSPARIVLLVDNSLTLRADVEKLEAAAREFAYEIYEGDQLLIVGYDEQAEIVADWTDDAKKVEASLKSFRKKGEPHLFDALRAAAEQGLAPFVNKTQKLAIVVIGDGLDRVSKTKFEEILPQLQKQNITVYALQIPDRTGGALRRDQPKPVRVIEQLAEGTGGRVFPANEPKEAAKAICDELRRNRYMISYVPTGFAFGEARRLLVVADSGINVRFKTVQPPVLQ
ncbi:MAG TPA: VWA domain-containing protein [Pyrinomonadaceae bacterium]|jgi:VWFA-related protein|nr:VWA domain-containing protein [Pyrinomonadaceae bacterium]